MVRPFVPLSTAKDSKLIHNSGVVYFASWDYWASSHFPWLPHVGTCAGHPYAAVVGCLILSSYLVLFISFYAATYKKAAQRKTLTTKDMVKVAKQSANAVANDGSDRKTPAMAQ